MVYYSVSQMCPNFSLGKPHDTPSSVEVWQKVYVIKYKNLLV